MAKVVVTVDKKALATLLEGVQGPVAAELVRRAIRVQNEARRLTPVDTGRLRASVTHELAQSGNRLLARVGTNVKYAMAVHEGTGIYGPEKRPITPKTKKFLRFPSRSGGFVYTHSVKGMRPRPFLRDALRAAK